MIKSLWEKFTQRHCRRDASAFLLGVEVGRTLSGMQYKELAQRIEESF